MRIANVIGIALGTILFSPHLAAAQAPPMKMGLWQTTTVITTTYPPSMASIMQQAAGPSGKPMTSIDKKCFTLDMWQNSLGMKSPSKACNVAKRDLSGKTLTFSMTCSFGGGTAMALDATETIDSPVSMHGTSHTVTSYGANVAGGGKSVSDGTMTAKYLGSDCGSLKPDGHPATH